MAKQEERSYFYFNGPKRVHKAMETLEGYLKGIAADGTIKLAETDVLKAWLSENKELVKRPPFVELANVLEHTFYDGVIEHEEHEALLSFCKKFEYNGDYYDEITSGMQILQGMLGGIIADEIIKKEELDKLQEWMQHHEHLKGYWPFDEIDSLVVDVLEDGIVDEKEHELLMKYFSEFSAFLTKNSETKTTFSKSKTVAGVCSTNPEIDFEDKNFCLTGTSQREPRKEIKQKIESIGGAFHSSLRKDTDYLIICSEGSDCWTFACYGRKVEKAVNWRKEGSKIQIIHEFDFWDAYEDSL